MKEEKINEKEKELFEMIYQWGRVGVVTDFTCNSFQDKLAEIKKATLNKQIKIAEQIIRDILELMPKKRKNGISKFVNFIDGSENVGIILKSYAIDHNIPPFNRIRDRGLINLDQ